MKKSHLAKAEFNTGVQILGKLELIRPAIVMVPVWLGVPPMISSVPPLVVGSPAMLTLRSKFMPPVARLGTLRAVPGDGIVEPNFSLFDALPAFVSFVSVSAGCGDKK